MTEKQTRYIIRLLTEKGVRFDGGLSNDEVMQIENKFNFVFPPDLKLFLQTGLPISGSFINWRKGLQSHTVADEIVARLEWPLEGMLFDIRSNNFWMDSWGTQPDSYDDKVLIAKKHFVNYPKLIPIYSHRYISSEPHESDNPVFSVYQMDIIYYGYNLAAYLAHEFKLTLPDHLEVLDEPKIIEFWSGWTE